MTALATTTTPHASEAWWETNGATSTVDPKLLAPDPYQPRKFIVESELNELTESVRNAGVRERLIISPLSKMPWIELGEKYEGCTFLISSGHRRQMASLRAQLKEVPIEIKIYPDEKAHREDAALLNAQRVNLSALEEAYEIERRKNLGESIVHIAASFGKSEAWATFRLCLTRLDSSIQERLNPNLSKETILATSVATDLGGVGTPTREKLGNFLDEHDCEVVLPEESASEEDIRHAYQRALLEVIESKHMNATAAREFIVGSKRTHGAMHREVDRNRPSKHSRAIKILFKTIEGHVAVHWDAATHSYALRTLEMPEAQELVSEGQHALKTLGSIVQAMEQALERKKAATHYTTPQMMKPTAKPSAIVDRHAALVRPTPSQPRPQSAASAPPPRAVQQPVPQAQTRPAPPQPAERAFEYNEPLPTRRVVRDPSHTRKPEPKKPRLPPPPIRVSAASTVVPPRNPFTPKVTNVWSVKSGRFVSEEITSAEQYVELWDKKLFKWQQEGLEKPSHLPEIEAVRAMLIPS